MVTSGAVLTLLARQIDNLTNLQDYTSKSVEEIRGHFNAVRIEQGDDLLVAYPCVYDPRQRRITAVDGTGRQAYRQVQVMQLM